MFHTAIAAGLQADQNSFQPRAQGTASREQVARMTAELNKLKFPTPAAVPAAHAEGLEKTFEASLQFLSRSDPLPFQPGSAAPARGDAKDNHTTSATPANASGEECS